MVRERQNSAIIKLTICYFKKEVDMNVLRLVGLFTIIPATMLLTVSFFVLFALRKIETQGLKAFGYVIASLLWVGALLFFSAGVYTLSTGRPPLVCMMQEMMKCKMRGMMGGQMPAMMQGQKPEMRAPDTMMKR
jgi:hypothetical protein